MALLGELLLAVNLPLLLATAPIVLLITNGIYNLFFHPLASVPGPFLARLSPLWIFYHSYVGDESSTIDALHRRYGPVMRVAPNEIDISDGAALAPIYTEKGGFLKAACYRNFDIEGHQTIFSAVDPAHRAARSKAVAPMFALAVVRRDGLAGLESLAARLVDHMRVARAKPGVPYNLLDLARRYAVDGVTGYLFGRCYGGLDELDRPVAAESSTLSASAFVDTFVAVGRYFLLPNRLFQFVEMLIERLYPDKEVDDSMQVVSSFTDRLADDASETDTTYQGRLIAAGISRNEASVQCKDLMFAGTDSTATNIATICWHLVREPDVYARLRDEVQQNPDADMDSLPFLRATVREGLRHALANPTRLPRVVPPAGWSFGGYRFPAGTNVGCAAYSMHFDPNVFAEPRAFKPQRWLDGNVSPSMLRDNMPFGLGPRQCIARNLATLELTVATRRIVEADVLAGARNCGLQGAPGRESLQVVEWFNAKLVGHSVDLVW